MSNKDDSSDAPPSYDVATASSSTRPPATSNASTGKIDKKDTLGVPGSGTGQSSGIPAAHRRSMEDENRPLPEGWVRTFDPTTQHQFFVDTTKDPPRSIWTHPYDDEEYVRTLPSDERERIQQENMGRGHPPSKADLVAALTDEEDDDDHHPAAASASSSQTPNELPPRPDGKGKKTFGRKLKDTVTGKTHEQRVEERQQRAQEEQRMYEQHQRIRQAMAHAAQTGQPVLIGVDSAGKEVYVEPPSYNGGYGYGGGYGYNPYDRGVYSTPNAHYIRPTQPYGRPYGYGYGGGYGLPLAIGGGLLGGMVLGDLAFGGFGF